jgi:nanoRNase/pAp phosphatase (c-di-AMP/oligoRNAs hydrolase)
MTSFVESCVSTVADSASAANKGARRSPRAKKLLKVLEDKKNILVTTHMHPDPDALASGMAMTELLRLKLKNAKITFCVKGRIGGGVNDAFTRYAKLNLLEWDECALTSYDAIVLLDTQPMFAYSPLPHNLPPTVIIDHHPARGRSKKAPFVDIRKDVGATSTIVFSYYMELEVPVPPDLSATLLYAIESDLAGAAGMPNELDNVALSSLTLTADTRRLYQMRNVDLPQYYYVSYAAALQNAMYFDYAITSFIGEIDSLEQPAVMADFLLRFDKVTWALVAARHGERIILSLRSSDNERSAGDIMRKLVRKIGEGGGHRSKAGGFVRLENGSDTEVERVRKILRGRLLRALGIRADRGAKLVNREA